MTVWMIILEYLRLELVISFRWEFMLFALAPGMQFTVCDGVADLIFLISQSRIAN